MLVSRPALLKGACAALLLAALLPAVPAQESARGVFLIARPGLPDPNFSESVVLVARGADAPIGVIVNRPLSLSLAEVLPGERFRRFDQPMRFGGPVAPNALLALFAAESAPAGVITMAPGLHLAVDPDAIDRLLHEPPATIRFFSGYSGWAPGQLDAEIARGDWFVLDADAENALRADTSKLWQQLLVRARAVRAQAGTAKTTTRRVTS